jgi:hypothetical protein
MTTGKYRFAVGGAAGFFIDRAEASGADFKDGLLTLSEGDSATVSLTLSGETGGLKGFVMKGDMPVEAVLAVLAPAVESQNPAKYRGYQTESDGSFDFRNLPAGRYFLFAVEDTGFEYANPAAIRPYLAEAKVVSVASHQTSTERIPVSAAKEP